MSDIKEFFGELGVLTDDGVRVQCHICGKWFHHLGTHVFKKHNISADEYRLKFGLNRTTPLSSPVFAETQRRSQTPRLSKYWDIGKTIISNRTAAERSQKMPSRLQGNLSRAAMNRRPEKIASLRNAAKRGTLALLSNDSKQKSIAAHQTVEYKERAREKVSSGESPLFRKDVREKALMNAQSVEARKKRIETMNSAEVKAKRTGANSHNKRLEMRQMQSRIAKCRKRNQGRFAPGPIATPDAKEHTDDHSRKYQEVGRNNPVWRLPRSQESL
jgi:hypothetical protein